MLSKKNFEGKIKSGLLPRIEIRASLKLLHFKFAPPTLREKIMILIEFYKRCFQVNVLLE